ncbi:MAG: phosphonate C-P lyase system protein PhnG, partial [Paracoccus sp. (in: a-proteobacteria)]|nr:phosphonate C-P lyase system protein PhnG [Paracoccus sp. (in: a-proteobacteria)]
MSQTPFLRRDWLSILARSAPARLAALLPDLPAHDLLRAPETGTVMVQGRVAATGAPF